MASEFALFMTETAVNDLDDILSYIANTLCNPQAAQKFYEKLNEAFKTVSAFPETGACVNNPAVLIDGVRKMFVKNYTVFYLSDYENEKIIVLRVVYSHRNVDEMIHKLNM